MRDEQAIKQWVTRVLADFRIYSPLYKITVTKLIEGYWSVSAEVDKGLIKAIVQIDKTKGVCGNRLVMTWRGDGEEQAASQTGGEADGKSD